MPSFRERIGNRLLSRLPQPDFERLEPHLQTEELALGTILHEPRESICSAYFPASCITSLLYELENGESAEMAIVGNEGMVGVALFLGGLTMPNRAVVQVPGSAHRLDGSVLKTEFDRGGDLHDLLLRYTQALVTQTAQTAVCNRHHSVVQQLCRWLLLSVDRMPGKDLTMTQQLIADMLGVRRAGVTEAAGKLQQLGVISYRRGNISVLDRPGLEELSCECYAVVRDETDRLMGAPGGAR